MDPLFVVSSMALAPSAEAGKNRVEERSPRFTFPMGVDFVADKDLPSLTT